MLVRRHSEDAPWTYALLDQAQRGIAEKVREGEPGLILFSELAPVITQGRRRIAANFTKSDEDIRAKGVDRFFTDRGGCATYHGPGQWVVFVVESLEKLTGDRMGVRLVSEALMRVALHVARQYLPEAEERKGVEAGIWASSADDAPKVVSMGFKIERGVLLHGLCFNGFATEQSFYGVKPCGLEAQAGYLLSTQDQKAFMDLMRRIQIALKSEFPVFAR